MHRIGKRFLRGNGGAYCPAVKDLFVDRMNARAKELAMNDTVFVNCTGLPAAGQYSCAKDVAAMLSELMKHAEYFTYSRIWMDEIGHSGGRVTEMANTNKMIRSYQGCDAGKTGYTSEAGFCLAASALRGNHAGRRRRYRR